MAKLALSARVLDDAETAAFDRLAAERGCLFDRVAWTAALGTSVLRVTTIPTSSGTRFWGCRFWGLS
jgi:hypothetical protein